MNTQDDKPLPKPPTTPFGRKKSAERGPEEPLTADRMAQAAAEGKLDEFLAQEMPDNEYARNLAAMMMGMTGMMPAGGMQAAAPVEEKAEEKKERLEKTGGQEEQVAADVPDDVRQSIMSGDVQGLMDKLRREHARRNPGAGASASGEQSQPEAGQTMPTIDKELIDGLVEIARTNNVSLDWIILRAIKVYVQEYGKTGKL